jgi:hypothetical protein
MLGALEIWYGKEDGAVEMVLGGGRVLIPSKHRRRFNGGKGCDQGDCCYSRSRDTALEEFPIVLRSLCHFWCCHRDGLWMSVVFRAAIPTVKNGFAGVFLAWNCCR